MSGVSVDTDTAASAQSDLAAIMNGAENFMARMKALTDMRDANMAAVVNLKLGMSVLEAKAKVDAEARTVSGMRQEAQDELSRAKADAGAMIATANRRASNELGAAKLRADEARRKADAMVEDANLYAEKTRNEASALKAEAERLHGQAEARHAAAEEAVRALQSAKEDHEAKAKLHNDASETLRRKIGILHEAISQARGI